VASASVVTGSKEAVVSVDEITDLVSSVGVSNGAASTAVEDTAVVDSHEVA